MKVFSPSMRIRFIWVGKTRNEPLRCLVEDFLARLKRFVKCEITELRESAAADERAGSADESKRILAALPADAVQVLLDLEGRQWSSAELAAQVENWQNGGVREVVFVIGGPAGVTDELRRQVSVKWSLSRLTLTHEMARVVLLEQLYRAYAILHGLPYHK